MYNNIFDGKKYLIVNVLFPSLKSDVCSSLHSWVAKSTIVQGITVVSQNW